MASRSLRGPIATGVAVCMQPASVNTAIAAVIGDRKARASRTKAILLASCEMALVLPPLWLTNRWLAADDAEGVRLAYPSCDQAGTPVGSGHATPVPPSPQ